MSPVGVVGSFQEMLAWIAGVVIGGGFIAYCFAILYEIFRTNGDVR